MQALCVQSSEKERNQALMQPQPPLGFTAQDRRGQLRCPDMGAEVVPSFSVTALGVQR
jgi:hypothetical protein